MRDFCKFSPKFLQSALSAKLKALGIEALLLAQYLQTNHHSTMLGAYYLPISYIAHDTGISEEHLFKLLAAFKTLNFCHYDFDRHYIWVVDLALTQVGEVLRAGDKRLIALQRQFEELPNLNFIAPLYAKYEALFYLNPRGDIALEEPECCMDAPSMDHQSKYKEKKKEKEKNKETEKENTSVASLRPCEGSSPLYKIFEHWKLVMNHPNAHLDAKRNSLIAQALKWGYSLEQLCDAITGCSLTPHNIGENERGQRYDGLHIILRSADQIDRFIRNCHTPPKQAYQRGGLYEKNLAAAQIWLAEERAIEGEVQHALN